VDGFEVGDESGDVHRDAVREQLTRLDQCVLRRVMKGREIVDLVDVVDRWHR
jgi:hypothetical protein